ncbi:MAG TPA: PKD domain-containing protein, partial [Solirubrobacteraceae bacterium]|nr:PKD domain-containing protein [Solirubrobacteraceae bacterium]
GGAFETITVKADERTHEWGTTFANLPEGRYTVLARQSDEAGNGGASEPRGFAVTIPAPPLPPAPAPSPSPPTASFTWVPVTPTVGQSVSFVSKSTDPSSPLTAFAWDLSGSGAFAAGGPVATATFTTAGTHTVRLLVSDANGLSNEVAETVNVGAQALRLMQPFPIVRIAGSETSFGARVKLLTVQAPAAAKVTVSCKGRGCKTRSESRVATASSKTRSVAGAITLSFPRFERALQAGAVLQIRVSRSGEIGKFTSFTIRRRKLPLRVDACLRPPSAGPSSCPSQ